MVLLKFKVEILLNVLAPLAEDQTDGPNSNEWDDPEEFVNSFEDFTLDESMKWFTKPSEVGRNRPLLKSFSRFANANKDRSICFLIKVNSFNLSDAPFELKLENAGNLLVQGFVPPGIGKKYALKMYNVFVVSLNTTSYYFWDISCISYDQ